MVEHAVIGRYLEVGFKQGLKKAHSSFALSSSDLLKKARLGIPQGSASSSIVSAYCMSRLQWAPIEGVTLLNIADDFLLLATNKEARAKGVDVLVAAVGNLPSGKFNIELMSKRTASQGICFLGHEMQMRDGVLRTCPSIWSHDNLLRKLSSIERGLSKLIYVIGSPYGEGEKASAITELARYLAIINGWRAAFSECDEIDLLLADAHDSWNSWRAKVGVSVEEVKAAITPDMEYRPSSY